MANKSGISEQIISLPTGGGELKGLGESFSPDLHTGTGNFSIPISLPPGRNGFQPEIQLVYSTGNGNSCFGQGWQLSIPGVSRKTSKGIPRYSEASEDRQPDTFLLSGTEDLVPVAKAENWTQFRPRTEGLFAIIKRYRDSENDYWEVKSKDGLSSYYNRPEALHADSATIYDPDKSNDIFEWKLSETRDPFGNRIVYRYQRDLQKIGRRHWNQLYLEKIQYLNYTDPGGKEQFLVSVTFEYDDARPDAFSAYTSGFEIRTEKRCRRISIRTHPSAGESILVRTYALSYAEAPYSRTSLLTKVQATGHDDQESEQLPPLEFQYTPFEIANKTFKKVGGRHLPTQSLANPDVELVDLFSNGLPDIIEMNDTVRYWKNLGNGHFDLPRLMKQAPAGLRLADPKVQFIDAEGNGRADLAVYDDALRGFFSTQFDGTFDRNSFQRRPIAPTFGFDDPEVKLVDLNGDGITDALRSGSRMECFFNDPEEGWNEAVFKRRRSFDQFPDVNLSDPRIRLADMTGDGLQDIVYIRQNSVSYWPNRGYGKWGKRIQMKNAPQLPRHYDPKRLLVGDIAGDGPHDFIYIDDRKVDIWINQNGNGFSEKISIEGTPQVSDLDAVRLADLYGSGVSGILWTSDQSNPGRAHFFFLDFTGGQKPLVLREMNNNMGAITKVEYRPSTHYYLRDETQKATKWKTSLPFSVQVVARVEVIDEISRNKLVTEYDYRHGYWDGAEREFRGFGRVEQKDTQSFEVYTDQGLHEEKLPFQPVEERFYSPPTKTVTWFHQGPVGSGAGDWTVCDFSDEYWQGDNNQLGGFSNVEDILQQLPTRRERRDALRTLRGSVLRTELYALDGKSDTPYTVSESLYSVRKEGHSLVPLKGMSGAIFLPLSLAQRTTQWERGTDPMSKFSFSKDYDAYGQSRKQIAVACPRDWNNIDQQLSEQRPFLATYTETDYIDQPSAQVYMKDRSSKSTTFEILHQGRQSLTDLVNAVAQPNRLQLIAQSCTYYDGEAFTGLPWGEIGAFGAPTRSENLAVTEDLMAKTWPGTTMPEQAGYHFYDGSDEHAKGYWTSASSQFDFQDPGMAQASGLPTAQKDPLGRISFVEYDVYHFLPVKSIDPLGLTVQARNDYRLLRAYCSIDPNENVGWVKFSPLGFVTATFAIGKEGTAEGDGLDLQDTEAAPSKTYEYNWLAWVQKRQPVQVKSTVREHHRYETEVAEGRKNNSISSIEFSDGFGRNIQTRAQAEEVLFGDELLGNEMLPEAQGDPLTREPFQGKIRHQDGPANVIVSGWQVYDNKGRVVQKYEPFYARGFEYADFSDELIGQKTEQFYDPLGRVILTRNPDGSEQRAIFGIPEQLNTPEKYTPSPWETYTYDENDNAGSTHAGSSTDENHWNTPSSIEIDAMGRTVRAIDRNGQQEEDEIVTTSTYDIRGNLLTVTDALGRLAFQHTYDLTFDEENGSQLWHSENIDAGSQWTLFNALGHPIENRDYKGAQTRYEYDDINRPTKIWARDYEDSELSLRQRLIYGDNSEISARKANLLGQLYQHYDEAGLVEIEGYDFKGNPLSTKRRVIKTSVLTALSGKQDFSRFQVDWEKMQPDEVLEAHAYETSTTFDALNRPKKIIYPEDVKGERKTVRPTYNRAGALESIEMTGSDPLFQTGSKPGVRHIAYNARGQRTLVAYHNGLMTRYAYDDRRFWLKRLRTERFEINVDTPFGFQPKGGVLQDIGYEYDPVGNVTKIKARSAGTGILGSVLGKDALDRTFTYDPLYRLRSATGREHTQRKPRPSEIWQQEMHPTHSGSVTNPATRFYNRTYQYDPLGNLLELMHTTPDSTANFTRTFSLRQQNDRPYNNQLTAYRQGGHAHHMQYDKAGNLIREATSRHYCWNHSNQLHAFRIQATDDSTPSLEARYLYGASGERVKKIVWRQGGKVTTTTYIDGIFEQHTLEDSGSPSTKANNTLHLMDDHSRIALIRVGIPFEAQDNSPDIQYQLGDHLGNVQVVATASGAAYSREEHYPYGGTSLGSYAQKRYRFTGKERDEESGLHYHSARYYAPWIFKWISADPAGLDEGINLYWYTENRPTVFVDELGFGNDDPPINKVKTGILRKFERFQGTKRAALFKVAADFLNDGVLDDLSDSPLSAREVEEERRSSTERKPKGGLRPDPPEKKNSRRPKRQRGVAQPINSKVNRGKEQSRRDIRNHRARHRKRRTADSQQNRTAIQKRGGRRPNVKEVAATVTLGVLALILRDDLNQETLVETVESMNPHPELAKAIHQGDISAAAKEILIVTANEFGAGPIGLKKPDSVFNMRKSHFDVFKEEFGLGMKVNLIRDIAPAK